jgi:transcription initiation factor IIF auxiliary subunit
MKTIWLLFLFFALPVCTLAQPLQVASNSTRMSSNRWQWKIYLVANSETLKSIAYVKYTLHPTFPEPEQIVNTMGSERQAFALQITGWGTFKVKVDVVFKNNSVYTLYHQLSFGNRPEANEPVYTIANIATRSKQKSDNFDWTIFIKGSAADINKVKCVQYTLHPTFPNPIRLICSAGGNSQMAFPLSTSGWGTFTVKVKIILKDGTNYNREHKLVF